MKTVHDSLFINGVNFVAVSVSKYDLEFYWNRYAGILNTLLLFPVGRQIGIV